MAKKTITVREYAETHGVNTSYVYRNLRKKEYAGALKGHVTTRKVNNQRVKVLDEVAVEILEQISKETENIVRGEVDDAMEEDKKCPENLWDDKQRLLVKVTELQDKLVSKQELITELSDDRALLLVKNQALTEIIERHEELEKLLRETIELIEKRMKLMDKNERLRKGNCSMMGLIVTELMLLVYVFSKKFFLLNEPFLYGMTGSMVVLLAISFVRAVKCFVTDILFMKKALRENDVLELSEAKKRLFFSVPLCILAILVTFLFFWGL